MSHDLFSNFREDDEVDESENDFSLKNKKKRKRDTVDEESSNKKQKKEKYILSYLNIGSLISRTIALILQIHLRITTLIITMERRTNQLYF